MGVNVEAQNNPESKYVHAVKRYIKKSPIN